MGDLNINFSDSFTAISWIFVWALSFMIGLNSGGRKWRLRMTKEILEDIRRKEKFNDDEIKEMYERFKKILSTPGKISEKEVLFYFMFVPGYIIRRLDAKRFNEPKPQ